MRLARSQRLTGTRRPQRGSVGRVRLYVRLCWVGERSRSGGRASAATARSCGSSVARCARRRGVRRRCPGRCTVGRAARRGSRAPSPHPRYLPLLQLPSPSASSRCRGPRTRRGPLTGCSGRGSVTCGPDGGERSSSSSPTPFSGGIDEGFGAIGAGRVGRADPVGHASCAPFKCSSARCATPTRPGAPRASTASC